MGISFKRSSRIDKKSDEKNAHDLNPVNHENGFDQSKSDQAKYEQSAIIAIQRDILTPILNDPSKLSHYADPIIQEQQRLLAQANIAHSAELGRLIQNIIKQLNQSKKIFSAKKYHFLHRWFGVDLEHQAGSINFLKSLEKSIEQATVLSQCVYGEIMQSQQNFQALENKQVEMSQYIEAGEQFLQQAQQFASSAQYESFSIRLDKKINMLMTSQHATDLAMAQIQLNQNVALTILDRFNEAKNVLIPLWYQQIRASYAGQSPAELEKLNRLREQLIRTLDIERSQSQSTQAQQSPKPTNVQQQINFE
ncbi:hypothetical protein MKI79_10270 [Acinetobacter sp. A3.8]|uniref:Tellurium resistance protein n=1 Tax=Acinetobacter sedimenti TaxID=2919922 RepID=A0A9X1WYE2_9GAMM|nr:hypothetical protein [Acinetobacter sedimenti]MCJ8147271.1 hypothetical protein [Acinetobacter sedimenti]